MNTEREIINEQQAADILGVRPQTLATWRCVRRYNLPFIKVGRLVRYRRADLENWLQSRLVGAEQK